MADGKMLHPAITVTNIRNFIPVTLEMEKGQYSSWAELFKIHCRAFQVLDHIIPSTSSSSSAKTAAETDLWSRIDAIVLQWIYGTISNDLLHTILIPDSTAAAAWNALANIYQDNKNSRAVYLENKFSNTRLDSFSNISAYCQELKMISDQLANVGAPIQNQRLVLQLIAGLNEQYDGVAMLLQQTNPLPDFYEARSKLILEENRKASQAATAAAVAGTALHAAAAQQPAETNKQVFRCLLPLPTDLQTTIEVEVVVAAVVGDVAVDLTLLLRFLRCNGLTRNGLILLVLIQRQTGPSPTHPRRFQPHRASLDQGHRFPMRLQTMDPFEPISSKRFTQ